MASEKYEIIISFKQNKVDGTWSTQINASQDANAYVALSMLKHHTNDMVNKLEKEAQKDGYSKLQDVPKEWFEGRDLSDIYEDIPEDYNE